MADNALMRHRRMQETQRAFADQFDRPTPQDYPVVERSSLLPLATYANGQTGLAWPGMIAEDIPNALTAPSRAYRGELGDYADNRDAYLSEGLNFAGTAAVGGSVVPKPTNAAGMFRGRLVKAEESRAPWYRRMLGDNTLEITGYRGSPSTAQHWRRNDEPVFASSSPDTASAYAMEPWRGMPTDAGTPNVSKLKFRFSNPYVYDAKGKNYIDVGNGMSTDDMAQAAIEKGHDGMLLRNVIDSPTVYGSDTPQTTIAALKRGTVFDPNTGDLLFANSTNSSLPGTILAEAAPSRSKTMGELPVMQRPFSADYPTSPGFPGTDLTKTIDGNYIRPGATVVGRQTVGGPDVPLPHESQLNVLSQLGIPVRYAMPEAAQAGVDGYYMPKNNRSGRDARYQEHIGLDLNSRDLPNVLPHELGHALDARVGGMGVNSKIKDELAAIYSWQNGGKEYVVSPDSRGYAAKDSGSELIAEALRGYMQAPGTFKEVAPNAAAAIRSYVNTHPEVSKVIQFNANSTNSTLPGTILAEAADQAPRVSNPIRAYHGSPHDFDRFDMSKIGTGEGAQAYGHGLYFAENEGVAKSYRQNLSGPDIYDVRNPSHIASRELTLNPSNDAAIASLTRGIDMAEKHGFPADHLKAAKELIEKGEAKPHGRMYEVSIHADPNDFLDWDKPLSQQSEKVKGALDKAGLEPWQVVHEGRRVGPISKAEAEKRAQVGGVASPWAMARGKDVAELAGVRAPEFWQRASSDNLREAGIPGIRYLDQGSRGAGEGSRNYVVFDDALIEILRKYGLLGTLGAGAAASSFGAPPAEAAPVNALMRR